MIPVDGLPRATQKQQSFLTTLVSKVFGSPQHQEPAESDGNDGSYVYSGSRSLDDAAQLPQDLLIPRSAYLSGMHEEDVGWVAPWTMYADKNGHCYLRDTTYSHYKGGLVCMRVERDSKGRYHVHTGDIYKNTYEGVWERTSIVGKRAESDIPVASITP